MHVFFSSNCNEEITSDDEILSDNCPHGTCDSMDNEMDRSVIIIRIEVGLASGYNKTDNVELGSPRDNDIDKVKKLFHCEVCKMETKYFPELCFAAVKDSSGNLMVMITQ